MRVQHLLMLSYSPLIDFKPITSIQSHSLDRSLLHHNSDLAKEWLRIRLYLWGGRTGWIVLRTCKVHLTALFTDTQTDTHTDKYDLKVRYATLRTLTNSFTLRARNDCKQHVLCLKSSFSMPVHQLWTLIWPEPRALFFTIINLSPLKVAVTRSKTAVCACGVSSWGESSSSIIWVYWDSTGFYTAGESRSYTLSWE